MLSIRSFLVAAALVGASSAQSFFVPTDTPATGTCNAFPFSTTDMRYQALILASDLGNAPAIIRGFSLAPCSSGVRSFTRITMKMAHLAATTLSTTFDQNLAAGPLTVMDIPSYTWNLTANVWNDVDLQVPFPYNGVDNVVVEFLVTGSSGAGGTMHRDATHQRVYLGSYAGQLTGTNGGLTAFKMRLITGDGSLQVFGAGCVGSNSLQPALSFAGTGQLGTALGVQLDGVLPTVPAVLHFGSSTASPFPLDLSASGAPGCFLYHDVWFALPLLSDPLGQASVSFNLPRFRTAIGLLLYFQWAAVDLPANALGVTTSSYGRALVGN